MAQTSTNAQVVELIKSYKGLHDFQDSVSRPEGTSTTVRNTIELQTGDVDRRQGRDFVSLDASGGAINIITDLQWDDGGVSVIELAGSGMEYETITYPNTGNFSGGKLNDPGTPGPMPNWPEFPAFVSNPPSDLPDFTSFYNALAEARSFANGGTNDLTAPTTYSAVDFYDKDGNVITTSWRGKDQILDYLAKGYYPRRRQLTPTSPNYVVSDDYYWVDYFCWGVGAWVSHLNTLRGLYNSNVLTSYLKTWPVENETTIANYTAADAISEICTFSNWNKFAKRMAIKINSTLQLMQA